ncbi:aminotransferase class IV [Acidocella aminolytica]|jgi:branched-chain amino acid aminotransferase|uniref:Probable branched-chain-amino-acid aminotransferase n=1 Tax=Acidocella aminolytica 101 = DSM 11237 TaxID=1120923 RepID=A0A0D6PDV9_9PROT|nr:aminotransferase class IV [Acidocella aminolytica]GAN79945.1 aminotransferase [Acidocella aminolytica 101 = DSM 11237]GBQ36819.1 aminotransferase [Acidocella aminolytica 101 = DSM 11237]SHE58703.1 branched-chain amino acid aminotransferase [Acidocella aminolytica 101 = DSM 11237]
MDELVWLNGQLIPAVEALIPASDRGFTLGDGLFETLCLQGGVVRDVPAHFARLAAGAKLLRLPLPFHAAAMDAILTETAAANHLTEGGLRLTVTRGTGPRGLLPPTSPHPTVLVSAFAPPSRAATVGAIIATCVARDEASPLSQVKVLNYLPNILARLEAQERGAEEALLLNRAGRVAGATIGNLLLKSGSIWLTPPVTEGALPGIRRARLLASGKVKEAPIDQDALRNATALCVSNVLTLRPIIALDGAALPAEPAGELAGL